MDDDGAIEAAILVGLRGRSWQELEADLLAAMCQETTVREVCIARFRRTDFSTARHREIFQALIWIAERPVTDEGLAAAFIESPRETREWRLAASPATPEHDADLFARGLTRKRGDVTH